MPTELQKYFETIAQTAGLDDASKGILAKLLENPKAAEELERGIKRQSDYSRAMDALATERKTFDDQVTTWRDWYKTASENDAARETELKELRAKAGTGSGSGSSSGSGSGSGNGTGDHITKADLEKALAQERGQSVALLKDAVSIA